MARQLTRALVGWRHEVARTRRLAWAEHVWGLRVLEPIFLEWRLLVLQAKWVQVSSLHCLAASIPWAAAACETLAPGWCAWSR